MLDFLGLREEAASVLMGCILMGIALGIQMGALAGYEKKDETSNESKATAGQIILLVLCIILGIAGFLMGILPGFVLFFTFQWKYILGAIFAGIVALIPVYFLSKLAVLRGRRAKYMRNPIVKDAVKFCKENNVVGIQCFADGMRFFTKIEHPGYCKKDVHLEVKQTQQQWEDYKENWQRPESWIAYHHQTLSCVRVIRFADHGYPNVPDLSMFASALAKKLGFAYAQHSRRVKYDTVSWSGSTRTTTHNIAILHEDCFVYSPKAYRKCLREWEGAGLLQQAPVKNEKAKSVEKPKTWE